MELKDQVCSLELAKKLKELGVKQESLWYWIITFTTNYHLSLVDGDEKLLPKDRNDYYSAFTVAELGERLPHGVTQMFEGKSCYWYLDIRKHDDGKWSIAYVLVDNDSDTIVELNDDNLANAMAEMRIYLLENKLIEEG